MATKNPIVDRVLQKESKWRDEFDALRTVLLGFPFTEELKWGQACYTIDGKNVVLIHGFKDYCALLFIKGALLKDSKHILATPGAHQAARQIRFAKLHDVTKLKSAVKAYAKEAIEIERAGLKVKLKATADFEIPDEFAQKLKASAPLKKAFNALTPGRQRAYLLHFAQPKQSKTRAARVDKNIPLILAGKGLND